MRRLITGSILATAIVVGTFPPAVAVPGTGVVFHTVVHRCV